ncbi:MAG: hypothetical protein GY880_29850 [Planctomycetaceae bacterium]|nr:hypothetical protein [Planctomycetaceae bacterium]
MAIVSKAVSFILVIVSFNFPLIPVVDGETLRSTSKQTESANSTNWRLPTNPIGTVRNEASLLEYYRDQMVVSDMDVYLADGTRVEDSMKITLDHGSEELLDLELGIYWFLETLDLEKDMAMVSKKLSFETYCGAPKCAPSRKSVLGMYRTLQQTE